MEEQNAPDDDVFARLGIPASVRRTFERCAEGDAEIENASDVSNEHLRAIFTCDELHDGPFPADAARLLARREPVKCVDWFLEYFCAVPEDLLFDVAAAMRDALDGCRPEHASPLFTAYDAATDDQKDALLTVIVAVAPADDRMLMCWMEARSRSPSYAAMAIERQSHIHPRILDVLEQDIRSIDEEDLTPTLSGFGYALTCEALKRCGRKVPMRCKRIAETEFRAIERRALTFDAGQAIASTERKQLLHAPDLHKWAAGCSAILEQRDWIVSDDRDLFGGLNDEISNPPSEDGTIVRTAIDVLVVLDVRDAETIDVMLRALRFAAMAEKSQTVGRLVRALIGIGKSVTLPARRLLMKTRVHRAREALELVLEELEALVMMDDAVFLHVLPHALATMPGKGAAIEDHIVCVTDVARLARRDLLQMIVEGHEDELPDDIGFIAADAQARGKVAHLACIVGDADLSQPMAEIVLNAPKRPGNVRVIVLHGDALDVLDVPIAQLPTLN